MLQAGYDLGYSYANNPQQISNIADTTYRTEGTIVKTLKLQQYGYDANGNLLYVNTGTKTADGKLQATNSRKLLWDEENRLLALSDNGFVSNYWYDAAGERTVKESGDAEGVSVNGFLSAGRTGTTNFTAYISPYLVVSNGGNYTKHIYMGSQRITSKVSNSEIFAQSPVTTTDLQATFTAQTAKIKVRYDSLGVVYKGTAQSGGLITKNPTAEGKLGVNYFYHSDHLGSSSLITDQSGAVTQHLEYVPFGETFIDERRTATSWTTPYLFSAKERDEETGLSYFGARYYDSKTSVWLSVDPLAEKYPNYSPYVYCYNNPVNVTDPDGREGIVEKAKQTYQQAATWAANHPQVTARVDGALKVAGGLVEGVVGLAASCAGVPAGPAALAHGSDVGGTGINQLISGQFQNTAVSGALQQAGVSPGIADAIDGGVSAALTAGASVGLNATKGIPAPSIKLTTEDGFLLKGFDVKAPADIPVQRFGNMSVDKADFWGAKIGTNKFSNRTFNAIKPEWNSLNQYTKGVIPKGSPMKIGIIGPQGLKYPGGSIQFITNSRNVINQSTKLIGR